MENNVFSTGQQLAPDTTNSRLSSLLQQFKLLLDTCRLSTADDRFTPLVTLLMNKVCLVVRGEGNEYRYRIVECEVYYNDPTNNHEDGNTHNAHQQITTGQWYFNYFGLDITIGKEGKREEEHAYGGILIRSLRLLPNGKYINGPSKVLQELFIKMGSVFNRNASMYLSYVEEPYDDNNIYSAPRVRLANKNDKYYNSHYRFVTELIGENEISGKDEINRRIKQSATTHHN
jgi:3-methyladenine DNA glycosylase Mpg